MRTVSDACALDRDFDEAEVAAAFTAVGTELTFAKLDAAAAAPAPIAHQASERRGPGRPSMNRSDAATASATLEAIKDRVSLRNHLSARRSANSTTWTRVLLEVLDWEALPWRIGKGDSSESDREAKLDADALAVTRAHAARLAKLDEALTNAMPSLQWAGAAPEAIGAIAQLVGGRRAAVEAMLREGVVTYPVARPLAQSG